MRTHDINVWHWRPETPAMDICLGAILVQHTAWTNVERALTNLRRLNPLSLEALAEMPEAELGQLVRPAGMPLTKARRLKAFANLAGEAGGIEALLGESVSRLRSRLLGTAGIGPETADVILLYAAKAPVVVHDAYTARLFRRLGLGPEQDSYNAWRDWLDRTLAQGLALRQANHAAIVLHCKELCRTQPKCDRCSLLTRCPFGQTRTEGG